MRPVSFEAGEWVMQRGEPAREMLLITGGRVAREDDGVPAPCVLGPLDLVGQEAAGLAIYQANVRALSSVDGWLIPAQALSRLCVQAPGLGALLTHSLLRPHAAAALAQGPQTRPASVQGPSNKVLAGWGFTLILPPILFALGSMADLSVQACIYLSIIGVVITMWVFAVVDLFLPPLLALICVLFIGLAPPSVVLAGFSSPSFVTLLGVFGLAAMLVESGLSTRVLLWLLLRLPDGSPWRQAALLLFGLVLSVGGNPVSRVLLLMPAFRDLNQGLRLVPGSLATTALFAGAYGGAMLFTSTFASGKSATISVIGLLPAHQQTHISGLLWIGAASLSTLLLALTHFLSVQRQFRSDESAPVDRRLLADRLALLGPMGLPEKLTALGFFIFLAGSLTTSLHQVPPSAVAGAVLVMLLVTGVMSRINFQKSIDWSLIVFLVSVDCLIRVMDYLGLATPLGSALGGASMLVQGRVINFLLLALTVVLSVRLLLPIPAGMLISAVVLLPIAQAEGVHPFICIFAIVVFSDIWFFRHQNEVYLMGIAETGPFRLNEAAFMRHNMVMNLARITVVFASIPMWRWMGL